MNCERSARRAWVREVAIGLGRKLTAREEQIVTDAWRGYRESLRYHPPVEWNTFPVNLCAQFRREGWNK